MAWSMRVPATGRYVAGSAIGTTYGTRHGQGVRYDRRTGRVQLFTISPTGEPADAWSHGTDISADGKTILFNTPPATSPPKVTTHR